MRYTCENIFNSVFTFFDFLFDTFYFPVTIGQGVGLAQAQGIGMALQLKSINAQTKLAEANAAKAYAEANKIAGIVS